MDKKKHTPQVQSIILPEDKTNTDELRQVISHRTPQEERREKRSSEAKAEKSECEPSVESRGSGDLEIEVKNTFAIGYSSTSQATDSGATKFMVPANPGPQIALVGTPTVSFYTRDGKPVSVEPDGSVLVPLQANPPLVHVPKKGIYVGRNEWLPLPAAKNTQWHEEIFQRLFKDLKHALDVHSLRRASKEIFPEFLLVGRAPRGKGTCNSVRLEPTVWLWCGDKACKRAVQKAIKQLDYLQDFSKGRIEIHVSGPRPAASIKSHPDQTLAEESLHKSTAKRKAPDEFEQSRSRDTTSLTPTEFIMATRPLETLGISTANQPHLKSLLATSPVPDRNRPKYGRPIVPRQAFRNSEQTNLSTTNTWPKNISAIPDYTLEALSTAERALLTSSIFIGCGSVVLLLLLLFLRRSRRKYDLRERFLNEHKFQILKEDPFEYITYDPNDVSSGPELLELQEWRQLDYVAVHGNGVKLVSPLTLQHNTTKATRPIGHAKGTNSPHSSSPTVSRLQNFDTGDHSRFPSQLHVLESTIEIEIKKGTLCGKRLRFDLIIPSRLISQQRVCIIGGLVKVGAEVLGLTTSHGLFFEENIEDPDESEDSDIEPSGTEYSESSEESETDSIGLSGASRDDLVAAHYPKNSWFDRGAVNAEQGNGESTIDRNSCIGKNVEEASTWTQIEYLVAYSYSPFGARARGTSTVQPNGSDFTLIQLPKEVGLPANSYIDPTKSREITINGILYDSELAKGQVSLVCGKILLRGYLLEHEVIYLHRDCEFRTRKIELDAPLGKYRRFNQMSRYTDRAAQLAGHLVHGW